MIERRHIIAEAKKLVDTLEQRGNTHGPGGDNFKLAADLLMVCGYRRRDGEALDVLDVILVYELLKIARILTGDRLEPDHWHDTGGYAMIGSAFARKMKEDRR